VIEPDDQDWTTSDPVTQVGDIWQVGDHIIACGNALIVQSWDTALTANANSDYSAVTTWARLPSQKFVLLHAKQIKLSSDKLVDAMIQQAQA
jgi:phage terminase large subunit-like protein